MKRQFSICICVALSMFIAMPSIAETTLKQLQDAGVVRLGFANEAPYSYALPDGSLAGIDFDLMKLVFAELGVPKVEGVLTPFGSLIPGLKADRFDVVGTGLYIRPDRCRQVAFSEPNTVVGSVLIVPAGNPKKLHSFEDLAANPNYKLGYVIGGTLAVAEAGGVTPAQAVGFTDVITAVSALKAGRTDAVLRTFIDATQVVRTSGDKTIEVAHPFKLPVKNGKTLLNYTGFAFRPEDKALVAAFNEKLGKLLGSPSHLAMLEKYAIVQPAFPIKKSTQELCAGI